MSQEKKTTTRWWEEACADARHKAVFDAFDTLRKSNHARLQDNLWFARLYGARQYAALRARSYAGTSVFDAALDSFIDKSGPRLTFNLVQSVIDTKVAKLSANTPRAMFVTQGGNWSQKQAAKALTKFADGLAYETKLAAKELDCLVDEEVMGGGVMYIDDVDGKVVCERVLPDEILVDDEEAFYGEAFTLIRWKTMPKDRAVELFARDEDGELDQVLADAITSSGGDPEDSASAHSTTDLVLVLAAWHLRSGPNANDGRYVVCVENATICDDEYTEEEFPFAFLFGQKRQVGFWGQGAAERLMPTQWALNKLYETIENQLEYGAVTRILRRRSARIPNSHVRKRRLGLDIIDVDAGAADLTVVAPDPVPSQLLQREEVLIQRGYAQEGVSEMDASAKKPAGLDSAPAQREYHDIASQRFMRLGKALEQFHLDCTRLELRAAKRIAEAEEEVEEAADEKPKKGKNKLKEKAKRKRGYKVRVPTGKEMAVVDLKDIDLPEDGYIMQAFPVSALPTTPAAKRAELAEWINMGWADQRVAMKLMNAPDLEDHASLEAAALDDIEATIAEMLEKGHPQTPEPYQDLETGVKYVQLAYLRGRREGAPEERLAMLQDWISTAKYLMDSRAPQPPAQAQALPPPGAPPPDAPPGLPPGAAPPGLPPPPM